MRISDWSSDVCSSDLPGLTITQGGALSIDYHQFVKDDQRLRLVGNLPYNISTPLLFHLLTQSDAVLDMHFMLQKEVVRSAERRVGKERVSTCRSRWSTYH